MSSATAAIPRRSLHPTVSTRATRPTPLAGRAEVVVGILADDGAVSVVRTALAEAASRRALLRVVRVLPVGAGRDEILAADSLAFAVSNAASDGQVSTPFRFEVVLGDPVQTLLERSRDAVLLVVGADRAGPRTTVARQCLLKAACPVRTVAVG